jgi:hypothetical protein
MFSKIWVVVCLLLLTTGVYAGNPYVVPTTTLAAQTANNTSAANSFVSQTNGNSAAGNVSQVDVHTLLYKGATTKVFAHLMLWFGPSNHMNVGYTSNDANQVHLQINDMVARGINGVVIDWYGQNNDIDAATKLVMAEAGTHPGFTFAVMIDQGAIQWYSCAGCTPQQALVSDLQYIQKTYFSSPAYLTYQGKPVVTNFNIDLSYQIDWNAAVNQLGTQPALMFQDNNGFSHVLSDGSYSWVMPTTTDYGMSYLAGFYGTGIPLVTKQTVGAAYKGFNDSLASWGSNRVMGQQCGQTWLQTFSKINGLYNSGKQLPWLQLVTWNDYEEGSEIETGISNCFSLTPKMSGNSLTWTVKGNTNTVDHYVPYISTDGKNLMSLGNVSASATSLNLCGYSVPKGNYTLYLQAVGKPGLTNQMSKAVSYASTCTTSSNGPLSFGTNPSAMTIAAGASGNVTVTAMPQSGTFNDSIALSCSGLPASLSCSFSPAAITPGAGTASSVLTFAAAARSAKDERGQSGTFLATSFFGFGLLGLTVVGKVKRERLIAALGACVLAAVIVGTTSCGGTSMGKGTSSVASDTTTTASNSSSYNVTVQGIAGSVTVNTIVIVTVK